MTKKLLSLVIAAVMLAMFIAGSALASAKEVVGDDIDLPGQDHFALVGTIQDLDPDGDVTTVRIITVLLHNGNRFVKPVDGGDTQAVHTGDHTEYNTIGLLRGETVSIHGTVDESGSFVADTVTVGVPCPACPELP